MQSTAAEWLRQLVRGEADLDEGLEALGVNVIYGVDTRALQVPAGLPEVELPLSDLARGFLATWAREGPAFHRWASTILMLDTVQFVEAESPEEGRLIEALWRASAGEPADESDLALARFLGQ